MTVLNDRVDADVFGSDESLAAFVEDAAAVVGAEDDLTVAAADLLDSPYDLGARRRMIGLLTSDDYSRAAQAAGRLSEHGHQPPEPTGAL